MSNTIICFDLDGTLIDIAGKYYWVHRKCSKDCGLSPIEKNVYWELKRRRVPELEILSLKNSPKDVELFEEYLTLWRTYIESKSALKKDTLVRDCNNVLKYIKDLGVNIGLATLRKNEENVLWEIKNLKLEKFFDKTSISPPNNSKPLIRKFFLFKNILEENSKDATIVGDTEVDLLSARYLGAQDIAVSYGIRNPNILRYFSSSGIIIDRLSEVKNNL